MNYYNYSGKKSQSRLKSNRKKIIINILIIVGIVALCVALALILGNHLKHRLEESDASTRPPVEEVLTPADTSAPDPSDEIDFVKNDRAEGSMSAIFGYLDLAGCPDEERAQSFVYSLRDDGYTGIVFNVRDGSGKYSYASKAASELTRTDPSGAAVPFDNLNGAVYAASALGMRSCAYIDLGDVFLTDETSSVRMAIDKAVIKELSAMGVSEIVLDGLTEDREFNTEYAKRLYEFVSSVRSVCPGTDFGLVISPELLEDPEKTPALELVFRFVDFFALDLADSAAYTPEVLSGMIEKYSGSFSAYSILALLGGKDVGEIRSGYSVFSQAKSPNAAFLSPRNDYEDKRDENGILDYSVKLAKYKLNGEEPADTGANGND